MAPVSVDFSSVFPGIVLRYRSGVRDTKCSLDTLKKEYAKLPSPSKGKKDAGFWQVIPARALASPTHLAWCVFSVLTAAQSNSLHFRQPELELLGRVAGTFQWAEIKVRVGLQDTDKNVILIWVGPAAQLSPVQFSTVAKKWGLNPAKWVSAAEKIPEKWISTLEAWKIERSALAALE